MKSHEHPPRWIATTTAHTVGRYRVEEMELEICAETEAGACFLMMEAVYARQGLAWWKPWMRQTYRHTSAVRVPEII